MTKDELELHQRHGHDPFDSRCKDCLLGGIKDRPHYRRQTDREENTLAIDIAGRFKAGKGEEGGNYKYLMVATFRAARWNWKETKDEATEDEQQAEKQQEEDTDDPFHPQDPVQEAAEREQQEPKESVIEEKASGSGKHELAQPHMFDDLEEEADFEAPEPLDEDSEEAARNERGCRINL